MTLKELLDQQEKKLDTFYESLRSGVIDVNQKAFQDFLRQNTIETVKWVMEMIGGIPEYKVEGNDVNCLFDDLIDRKLLFSELNKSIEDHA